MKSQLRNHEDVVRKLLEDAREPHYRGFCIGNIYVYRPVVTVVYAVARIQA